MYELNYKNDTVARIEGTISDSIISGVWINNINKKSFPLKLNETHKKIVPLPLNITGLYVDSICTLTLTISKKNGDYYYVFTSNQRDLKGKISFSRGSENILILEGIEYAENNSDVESTEENKNSRRSEEIRKKGKRTVGIECSLSPDEIIIQNYGNDMSYYVKLGECEEKYIHLIKQENTLKNLTFESSFKKPILTIPADSLEQQNVEIVKKEPITIIGRIAFNHDAAGGKYDIFSAKTNYTIRYVWDL